MAETDTGTDDGTGTPAEENSGTDANENENENGREKDAPAAPAPARGARTDADTGSDEASDYLETAVNVAQRTIKRETNGTYTGARGGPLWDTLGRITRRLYDRTDTDDTEPATLGVAIARLTVQQYDAEQDDDVQGDTATGSADADADDGIVRPPTDTGTVAPSDIHDAADDLDTVAKSLNDVADNIDISSLHFPAPDINASASLTPGATKTDDFTVAGHPLGTDTDADTDGDARPAPGEMTDPFKTVDETTFLAPELFTRLDSLQTTRDLDIYQLNGSFTVINPDTEQLDRLQQLHVEKERFTLILHSDTSPDNIRYIENVVLTSVSASGTAHDHDSDARRYTFDFSAPLTVPP